MPARKMTERSTKQELWDAYNNLLLETNQEQIVFPIVEDTNVSQSLKKLSDLKISFSQSLDKLGEDLLKEIEGIAEFKKSIGKQKQEIVEGLSIQRNLLESEIGKVRATWEEEKKQIEKERIEEVKTKKIERDREEENYNYNTKIKHRDEEDTYKQIWAKKEAELISRENILNSQEKEIELLKKEAELFPVKINEAVKKAEDSLTKEMKEKFSSEIRELNLIHNNEIKLLELKRSNSESTVLVQKSEIENLKKQISDLSRQLKEMAISVIENQNKSKSSGTSQIDVS